MRRSLRYLLVVTVTLSVNPGVVVGHEQGATDASSVAFWGKISIFVLGTGCIVGGVYIDQKSDQRVKYADYLVIGGFLLALLGGVSLYR